MILKTTKTRVVVIFEHFGPYHLARIREVNRLVDVTGLQLREKSRTYQWEQDLSFKEFRMLSIPDTEAQWVREKRTLTKHLVQNLFKLKPDVVAVNGWGDFMSLDSLLWCVTQGVPAILMSESTAWDLPRKPWVEKVKGRIVRLYSSSLVGGKAHREYLMQLGFPAERIETGYDAVDNSYFEKETDRIRNLGKIKKPYFLASARFLKRKNLDGLLRAYALYVNSTKREPWKLVILGDGEERLRLRLCLRELERGLEEAVRFEGFRQYGELPAFYAGAGAFVHPAHEEPWGLVVNEAMASGLPVLVSRRCGCAGDLVAEGKNGFLLDPGDPMQMAARMREMAELPDQARKKMGETSREIVARYGPEQFAQGMVRAAHTAVANPVKAGILDRLILEALARR